MTVPVERIPPHNLQAEESLLGAMLLSRPAICDRAEFCSELHARAFRRDRDAIAQVVGQHRADEQLGETEPLAVHPGQGTLL